MPAISSWRPGYPLKIRHIPVVRFVAMSAAATVPTFDPRDPLFLDGQLDDEERLIRDTVRQYVREKFLPHVAEHFEAGALADRTAKDLRQLGPLGMHPAGYGRAGASAPAYGLPCLEHAAGRP